MKVSIILPAILINFCALVLSTACRAEEAIVPAAPGLSHAQAASVAAVVSESNTAQAAAAPQQASFTAVDLNAAIKRSVESSASIRQALAAYKKAKAALEREEGVYDPQFKAGIWYSESTDKSAALQYPESEKALEYKAGLSARLFTGGDLSLELSSLREELYFPAYSGSIDASLLRPSINPYYYPRLALSYRQPLLNGSWLGRDAAKIHAAEYRHKAAEQELKEKIISQAYGLKAAYYEVYLADISQKAGKNYSRDTEAAYASMKTAGRAEAELLQAKAAMLASAAAVKTLEKRLSFAREKYLAAAGYPPAEWASAAVETDETVEEVFVPEEMTADLEETLVEMQPRVTAAKFCALAAAAEKDGAENSSLPELDLVGRLGLNGYSSSPEGAFGDIGSGKYGDLLIGADFSWSIPGRAGSGSFKEAKEELETAQAGYEKERDLLRIRIRQAYTGITSEKEYYEAANEARLMLEKRVKLLSQAGASSELLRAHRDRFDARKEEASAFAAYAMTIADWNRVNGKYDFFYNEYLKGNY